MAKMPNEATQVSETIGVCYNDHRTSVMERFSKKNMEDVNVMQED
jgi:hypothetical protein